MTGLVLNLILLIIFIIGVTITGVLTSTPSNPIPITPFDLDFTKTQTYILKGGISSISFYEGERYIDTYTPAKSCRKSNGIVSVSSLEFISSQIRIDGRLYYDNTLFLIGGGVINVINYNNGEMITLDLISHTNIVGTFRIEVSSENKVELFNL